MRSTRSSVAQRFFSSARSASVHNLAPPICRHPPAARSAPTFPVISLHHRRRRPARKYTASRRPQPRAHRTRPVPRVEARVMPSSDNLCSGGHSSIMRQLFLIRGAGSPESSLSRNPMPSASAHRSMRAWANCDDWTRCPQYRVRQQIAAARHAAGFRPPIHADGQDRQRTERRWDYSVPTMILASASPLPP